MPEASITGTVAQLSLQMNLTVKKKGHQEVRVQFKPTVAAQKMRMQTPNQSFIAHERPVH